MLQFRICTSIHIQVIQWPVIFCVMYCWGCVPGETQGYLQHTDNMFYRNYWWPKLHPKNKRERSRHNLGIAIKKTWSVTMPTHKTSLYSATVLGWLPKGLCCSGFVHYYSTHDWLLYKAGSLSRIWLAVTECSLEWLVAEVMNELFAKFSATMPTVWPHEIGC